MRNYKHFRSAGSVAALSLVGALIWGPMAIAKAPSIQFNIPAENTAAALNDFAKQAKVQILFPYDDASRFSAPNIKGEMTREAALAAILAGTNLEVASSTDSSISLRRVQPPVGESSGAGSEDLVVTGTRIRNAPPMAPIHTLGRKEIDQSGYGQIGDLLRSLPESFAGGQNPGVVGAASANIGNQNISNASTINLRGLGTDATLVLVNGRRLAPDYTFKGTDVSGIPLAAVQRIEVVTDGASALYGSDAVAGVANIILRRNYDGSEFSARLGGTTQGGGEEQTYSFLTGRASERGFALINLEYSKQDAVLASQRGFTSGAVPWATIVQPQERGSVFVSAGRTLSDKLAVSFDGLVSQRDAQSVIQYTGTSTLYHNSVFTPAYSVSGVVDYSFANDWKVKLTGGASGSHNSQWQRAPLINYAYNAHYRNDVQYIEAAADGVLFKLPTGDMKVAVGGGYRTEGFRQNFAGMSTYIKVSRNVSYLYAETLAPLVAASETRPGLKALDLSLSVRTEDYSDFGTTSNPRLGLRYVPFNDLTLRGTWGKSLKAPAFLQMYQAYSLYLYPAAWFGYTGGGAGIMTWGGNPDLKPERSTSWTVGADYVPARMKSLKLSATWFDIDYTDRVVQPITPYTTGLSNAQFAPFVEWSPSSATQAALLASGGAFYNSTGAAYSPSTVVAILHDRYTNASAQTAKGLDISYRQTFKVDKGEVNAFANATWLTLRQQTIVTAPVVRLSGTIFNAPKFKARAGLAWTSGGLSAVGIVNHIAGETDIGVKPNIEIASWTTLDANVAYRFAPEAGLAKGAKLALAVTNLLDRDPPHAVSSAIAYQGMRFDSTNTSAIGRTVSLTLSKAW